MIDPRSYILEGNGLQSFQQGALSGLELGAQYAQLKRAKEQTEIAKQQQLQMQQDLSSLASNPTAENYTKVMTMYPQLSENLKRSYETMTDGAKRMAVNTATQGALLLDANDADGAKALFESRAKAFENAGDIDQANAYKAVAKMAIANPEQAKLSALMIAGQGLEGDQFAEFFGKMGKERRDQQLFPTELKQANANVQKTYADIGQTQAQTGLVQQQTATEQQNTAIKKAEAENAPEYYSLRNDQVDAEISKIKSDERLGMLNYELDSDKLDADLEWRYEELDRKGTTLDGEGQKQVNDAVLESTTLATLAQQQKDLANKARNSGQAGGLISAGWEGLKNALGVETERSDMVREVTKMINSEVIKGLPPGPATDKDVELIRKGFPPATADGKTIGRFLDAMSNVNMAAAANKQMQAEWQSQNGNLGNSKRDLDVLGVRVPKGMTYQEFASTNMGKAIKQLEKNNSKQAINRGTASYMKYGQ